MSVVIAVLALMLVLAGAVSLFLRADPARIAAKLRILGPLAFVLTGLAAILAGSGGLGGLMLVAGAGWYGFVWLGRPAGSRRGRPSIIRTAALEIELDNDSGSLQGLVLAGRHEGRSLTTMTLGELRQLHSELQGDPESRQLLEAYLDGRFPVWRQHVQPDRDKRLGVAPGPGPMTKEEAYEVLGLEAGAAPADVRKAHRRLVQRMHATVGDTPFLVARLDEAKDVLLSNHD